MEEKNLNKQIAQLITSGRIKEAFNILNKEPFNQDIKNALSIIEAEYHDLTQEGLKGLLSFEEKQMRKNRINDKLLTLIQKANTAKSAKKIKTVNRFKLFLVPFLIMGLGLIFWWNKNSQSYECPEFQDQFLNKILVIPFENVGNQTAKPQIVLRDRINQLTKKNNLSTIVKIGEYREYMTIDEAPIIARQCGANAIIWGNYSSSIDSLRLILQYYFLEQPEWTNLGELVVLKDVTSIQNGRMLKSLDDIIMSLCGIIATRQGNTEIAQKWFNKVQQKEEIDDQILKIIKTQIN